MSLTFESVRRGTLRAEGANGTTYRVMNGKPGWFTFVHDEHAAVVHVEGGFARRVEAEAFAEEWEALADYNPADHDGKFKEAVAWSRAMSRLYPHNPKRSFRSAKAALHPLTAPFLRR